MLARRGRHRKDSLAPRASVRAARRHHVAWRSRLRRARRSKLSRSGPLRQASVRRGVARQHGLLAETARALDDAEHAVLYELLLPYGDRVGLSYPEISTGAVARHLGLLAAMTERWDDARALLRGCARDQQVDRRPPLARTHDYYARMLLTRDAPGDRDRHARWLQRRSPPTGSPACPPTGQAHRRSHLTLVGSSPYPTRQTRRAAQRTRSRARLRAEPRPPLLPMPDERRPRHPRRRAGRPHARNEQPPACAASRPLPLSTNGAVCAAPCDYCSLPSRANWSSRHGVRRAGRRLPLRCGAGAHPRRRPRRPRPGRALALRWIVQRAVRRTTGISRSVFS